MPGLARRGTGHRRAWVERTAGGNKGSDAALETPEQTMQLGKAEIDRLLRKGEAVVPGRNCRPGQGGAWAPEGEG
ncbi:MAG: hypothetical protein ACE5JL_15770 [Dehalococcoidia bacterium]